MTDHNPIQRLCTDLASREPELTLEPVYGLRQWFVGKNNLYGHAGQGWRVDGENVATCSVKHANGPRANFTLPVSTVPTADGREVTVEGLLIHLRAFRDTYPEVESVRLSTQSSPGRWGGWVSARDTDLLTKLFQAATRARYRRTVPDTLTVYVESYVPDGTPHPVAHPACTCGFYAYTDVESLHANSMTQGWTAPTDDAVFGIIRATGHITQGTRGFRAERAEIVALTRPQTYVTQYINPDIFSRVTDNYLDALQLIMKMETGWTRASSYSSRYLSLADPRYDTDFGHESLDSLLAAYRGPHTTPELTRVDRP